jgi:hypothetical protein
MGPCIVRIFQYISNKMQHYTVYYIWKPLYIFFGWYLHPSLGALATVSTAYGICHTVTATCRYRGRVPTLQRYLETALHFSGVTSTHHQERMQLYLQHLIFVTPLPLPAAIVEEFQRFHDSGRVVTVPR